MNHCPGKLVRVKLIEILVTGLNVLLGSMEGETMRATRIFIRGETAAKQN